MDRLACVDVQRLPVWMLARREHWRDVSVAWVDQDAASGCVLQANRQAEAEGVRSGMRYARALSLAPGLRAGTLTAAELAAQVDALVGMLHTYSPEVEAAVEPVGRFWLSGGGLGRLYGTPANWARTIRDGLGVAGFSAAVVVGFERHATGALVSRCADIQILRDPQAEQRAVGELPVASMIGRVRTCDTLEKLGIHRVRDLEALPMAGRIARFGVAATLPERARRFAPEAVVEPLVASHVFTDPVNDHAVLLAVFDCLLAAVLPQVLAREHLVRALRLRFGLEDRQLSPVELVIEPAEPTRDAVQLQRLSGLRLAATRFDCEVVELHLEVEAVPQASRQPSLFATRDMDAANRVLADLRARHGEDAVVGAVLRDAWLPGRDFAWEPLRHLAVPTPAATRGHRLVRRLLAVPRSLPGQAADRVPLRGVTRCYGPFAFSGSWWEGGGYNESNGYEQQHYLVATAGQATTGGPTGPMSSCGGELYWIAYDSERRSWSVLGQVD